MCSVCYLFYNMCMYERAERVWYSIPLPYSVAVAQRGIRIYYNI